MLLRGFIPGSRVMNLIKSLHQFIKISKSSYCNNLIYIDL